jgi:hypothetical protein
MALGISVVKEDLETLSVKIYLSGLIPGERYDVMRLQLRSLGKDNTGTRIYEREIPDRRGLWSSVAHRVGWQAQETTASFRDFETPRRPTQWFVVLSSKIGPHEYAFGDDPPPTRYPVSRGALSSQIVHFNGELQDIGFKDEPDKGHVLVRSVHELSHYADCCLVEMDGPTYTARVNEFAVMGNQYPVMVSDSREARRGSMTLLTRNLGQYNALRRVVFPESGRIRPFVVQSGGDAALLLDDMRVIPLDVEIEQATQKNADLRYVTIDYVEIDGSAPLIHRVGDLDKMTNPPEASFAISNLTPAANEWVQLTDTSTGQGDTWEWTVDGAIENKVGKYYGQGPYHVRFNRGTHGIKLRFGGAGEGFHTRTRTVTVG